MSISMGFGRRVGAWAAGALVLGGLSGLVAQPASADTAPADPTSPKTPKTVAADALPTVQVNGVVWAQEIVGNTVYVGGEFTQARPAGAAPGTQQVPRNNALAYDIRTGELLPWNPNANGMVDAIDAAPDGSRVYVGGTFTTINGGTTARRIAALNPTTGAKITAFNPSPSAKVQAIVATNDTVYYGGGFGVVNGVTRGMLAANRASDGALLSWAPTASDNVRAMAMSPDGTQILIGGEFQKLNGSSNPGWGLGSVDAVTGALLPWESNNIIRNANFNGATGAILSLENAPDNTVTITGYTYGRSGGSLEGTAKASWDGGKMVWVEDCHGDTYDSASIGDVTYTVSHAHYCGNVPGGFGQNQNWNWRRGMAFSSAATSTIRQEPWGYANWAGNPAPSILQWFPRLDAGTITGQSQAAYVVDASDDYVVMGGEFPRVNGTGQQGLVRFARTGIAPNQVRPTENAASQTPTLNGVGNGQVLVSWQSNWDRDNADLTYKVIRNGQINNPISVKTLTTSEWNRPYMSFLDTGLTPGSTATYRIFVSDAFGNELRSNTATITVPSSGAIDDYAKAVAASGPQSYWRFSEASGTSVADYTGLESGTLSGSVTRGVAGAVAGDSAATFPGSSSAIMQTTTQQDGPFWYSVAGWFRTTSNRGGAIVSFGSSQAGSSGTVDRTLYLDSQGRVNFGSRMSGTRRTLTSGTGYNNGQWHQVVGVQSDAGMRLYVDGVQVGQRSDIWNGSSVLGWWRVGGDNLNGWSNRPQNDYFTGDIDDVAIYSGPISGNEVRAQYAASGRSVSGAPADAYGQDVVNDGADAFWRLGETSGSTANDSSLSSNAAQYVNGPSQGQASAIGLGSDRSATFDGSNDNVAQNTATSAPQEYSAEAWVKTSTTSGGRILGFGNARTGTSSTADRAVFMTNSGSIRFATSFGGTQYAIESPQTYNDNKWHHVVATQDGNGMKLYVDGVAVGSAAQGSTSVYNGYWRVGGDSLAGVASRPTSDYFAGGIDEVAVYPSALSANRVLKHFVDGGGQVANQPPAASFTVNKSNLSVDFTDTSTDGDGTVASRSWSFGDGHSSTAANPTHVYDAAGTYTVELTVTDDDGAGATSSQQVQVSEPVNQLPTASFETTPNQLRIDVDANQSGDPDGSIDSYSWNWGDGSPSDTGVTSSHTYSQAGQYTVTLTVTDNRGGTAQAQQTVNVSTAPQVVAEDAFGRTTASGWGAADTGGTWTTGGAATRWSVSNGSGRFTAPAAGATGVSNLAGVSARDVTGTLDFGVDKLSGGGGTYLGAIARNTGSANYRFVARIQDSGVVSVYISKVEGSTETKLGAGSVNVQGLTYQVGDTLRMRFSAVGNGTTTLGLKVWKVGAAEPAADRITVTDSTAALQNAGGVGMTAYLSGSATATPLTMLFDNLRVNLAN